MHMNISTILYVRLTGYQISLWITFLDLVLIVEFIDTLVRYHLGYSGTVTLDKT